VAGIAEAFAGALSMGAGEFIAGRAEAQVQQAEVHKELEEMRTSPRFEFEELVRIYSGWDEPRGRAGPGVDPRALPEARALLSAATPRLRTC
jgi:hypothetical protein